MNSLFSNCWLLPITASIALALGLVQDGKQQPYPIGAPAASEAEDASLDAPVGIEFEGFLPGSTDETLAGTFDVEFRIYLSPQGGEAVWGEKRSVDVERGRMDLVLGEVNPIPWTIHEATFKFLGASVNGKREVYPRFAIVNVVYVSPKEAMVAQAELAAAEASGRGGAMRYVSRFSIGSPTEASCTWREALRSARRRHAELPSYRDWYSALATSDAAELADRSGHYEWVLPWVYDTASHGRYNAYFRGRFQGCDYMDLSPEKEYVWRLATPVAREATK